MASFRPKSQRKNLTNSALPILGQNLSNFSVGKLVETMKSKGHFEINWPLVVSSCFKKTDKIKIDINSRNSYLICKYFKKLIRNEVRPNNGDIGTFSLFFITVWPQKLFDFFCNSFLIQNRFHVVRKRICKTKSWMANQKVNLKEDTFFVNSYTVKQVFAIHFHKIWRNLHRRFDTAVKISSVFAFFLENMNFNQLFSRLCKH